MLRDIVAGRRLGTIGIAMLVAILSPVCLADDRAKQPDPADAAAPVPPITYQSTLDGFSRFGAAKPISWKSANDTVRTLGGHVGSMEEREIQESAPAAPGHAGHAPR